MQELGGSTAMQIAKLASGNIPDHKCHAQFTNRVDQGAGSSLLFSFP